MIAILTGVKWNLNAILRFVVVCFFVSLFGGSGVWTQGLTFAGQVLYHWSKTLALFAFSYFCNRVLHFLLGPDGPWSSYLCLPCSWDDRCSQPHSAYWLRWGLAKLLPWLTSNCHPLNHCLWVAGITVVTHHAQLSVTWSFPLLLKILNISSCIYLPLYFFWELSI
jgi:hypothetical protein